MNKYFVRIEIVTDEPRFAGLDIGTRAITGCADNRDDAERLFGYGNYVAVYAENGHSVCREAKNAGFL